MTRPRTTFQPGDEILAEIADLLIAQNERLGETRDLLVEQNRLLGDIRDRLPKPTAVELQLAMGARGKPAQVSEPAPARRQRSEDERDGGPVPVTEPAPADVPPEAQPVDEPAPQPEPDNATDDGTSVPPPPPRAGRGSGREAWSSFARLAKVPVPVEASRDDIIAACERAKVIEPQ